MRFNKLRIFCTLLMFFLGTRMVNAQLGKESWHWQFGDSCALDFSSGTPVAGKSSINTLEGCASISDPNTGQLLFYTDGTSVWDRNNNQMPNGFGMMGGYGTSTQAALIVPMPGSSTLYYIISADQGGYYNYPYPIIPNTGVHYSIVDMSQNNGLGDVLVNTKNSPLTPAPATEKLTAVKHCNGIDYWIITHSFNSNNFNSYLLNSSGINPTPIISSVGTSQNNISGTNSETIGYIKSSSNSKKIACAIHIYNLIELFDFDNLTGILSNPIQIQYQIPGAGAYGVEFSPDNTKLYSTLGSIGIFQHDISSNNQSVIMGTQKQILSLGGYGFIGSIQRATDNKIYISFQDSSYLSVINSPNNLGLLCDLKMHQVSLKTNTKSLLGLPNFVESTNPIRAQSTFIELCSFPSYTINATGLGNYLWQNGDTSRSHNINTYGDYWVSMTDTQGCHEVDTFHVIKTQPPSINSLQDTSQCSNLITPITLNASYSNVISYLWNDGFNSPVRTISNPGLYWVRDSLNNFCVSIDSFTYKINNIPTIDLGNDTTFCKGNLLLSAFNSSSFYLWSTGQASSEITVTIPNTYWVKVTNQYGCVNSDTLHIFPQLSAFNFELPNIVTPNNDGINDFIDFGKYQFSELQLEIYNRWGTKVFESSDPLCVWKPTEKDGTYYYVVQYFINCGIKAQNKTLKGFIVIVQ